MKILTTIFGAALLLGGILNAQTITDRVNVRFSTPVVVGDTKMPAGDCEIQVVRGGSDTLVLVVRSQAGPYTSVLATRLTDTTTEVSDHAVVVLDRVGDGYRLDRIVLPDHSGFQLQLPE